MRKILLCLLGIAILSGCNPKETLPQGSVSTAQNFQSDISIAQESHTLGSFHTPLNLPMDASVSNTLPKSVTPVNTSSNHGNTTPAKKVTVTQLQMEIQTALQSMEYGNFLYGGFDHILEARLDKESKETHNYIVGLKLYYPELELNRLKSVVKTCVEKLAAIDPSVKQIKIEYVKCKYTLSGLLNLQKKIMAQPYFETQHILTAVVGNRILAVAPTVEIGNALQDILQNDPYKDAVRFSISPRTMLCENDFCRNYNCSIGVGEPQDLPQSSVSTAQNSQSRTATNPPSSNHPNDSPYYHVSFDDFVTGGSYLPATESLWDLRSAKTPKIANGKVTVNDLQIEIENALKAIQYGSEMYGGFGQIIETTIHKPTKQTRNYIVGLKIYCLETEEELKPVVESCVDRLAAIDPSARNIKIEYIPCKYTLSDLQSIQAAIMAQQYTSWRPLAMTVYDNKVLMIAPTPEINDIYQGLLQYYPYGDSVDFATSPRVMVSADTSCQDANPK